MQTTWLERGTVSGRVALLLRSAEIQPLFIDLSDWIHQSNPPHHSSNGCLRLQGGLPDGYSVLKVLRFNTPIPPRAGIRAESDYTVPRLWGITLYFKRPIRLAATICSLV